ncbi:hypothetical protein C8R44DRAFT_728839 [Mycena epipterygia]|nr:hypothetical protein C8R44DRAFT_728839 [Mycena epipterygia]
MAGSRKQREESSEFEPGMSKEEKAKRARKATASHYRRNPEAREKKKLAIKVARAAKKKNGCQPRPRKEQEPALAEGTIGELAGSVGSDEEVASQVLTSMYLARQHETENILATPKRERDLGRAFSPLPPASSPEAAIPPLRPVKSRGWVSPGEWDDPGSPLPNSAYQRMSWPRLFRSLFGSKGDVEEELN